MRLVSFRIHTENRLGIIQNGKIVDLNSACMLYLRDFEGEEDFVSLAFSLAPPDMKKFLRTGEEGLRTAEKIGEFVKDEGDLRGVYGEKVVLNPEEVKLIAPIPNPDKVYCLAVNYYSHFAEVMKLSLEETRKIVDSWGLTVPVIFQKPSTSIIGPGDPIIIPKASKMVDYEVELAVVIGKKGKYIPREKAYDYIAGYTVLNDVSFRDQRFPDLDFRFYKQANWVKGKGLDNSAPTGPCLVLKDEIPNPYPLKMVTRVNGEVRQSSDTNDMIIKIPEIIEYLSDGITLNPGDIISTGTCAGVALVTGKYLQPGDQVEVEIEKIGVLSNPVVSEK